jgi:thiol-disulfide isomerase/thioredoxin
MRSHHLRKPLALLVIAALGTAACAGAAGGRQSSSSGGWIQGPGETSVTPPAKRRPAPRVQGALLNGGRFDSAAHRGTILVYNVWASWCVPCRAEAPALREVARQTARHGVRFIGINLRDDDANARAFERRYHIPYPSVVDRDGSVLAAFNGTLPINAIPATVVVDRQGRSAARIIGQLTLSKLRGLLDEVLSQDPLPGTKQPPPGTSSPGASAALPARRPVA